MLRQQFGFPVRTPPTVSKLGWGGPVDPTLRLTAGISGGPGGDIPISTVNGVPIEQGTSAAVSAETLTSHRVNMPEDLQPYANGDFKGLAIACLHVLFNLAHVDFPLSTRSAPSYKVYVRAHAPLLRSGDIVYFPQVLDWRRWKNAVLPVLQDDMWAPSMPVNNRRIMQERYTEAVLLLEQALLQSFQMAGYLPRGV
jgi:hypothetical protein